jgi:hypothetical protein
MNAITRMSFYHILKTAYTGKKNPTPIPQRKQGVCHTMALPFYIKRYLKAKEEFWKLKYFTMQKYNLPKIL